jgi:hypothetical protein
MKIESETESKVFKKIKNLRIFWAEWKTLQTSRPSWKSATLEHNRLDWLVRCPMDAEPAKKSTLDRGAVGE